MRFSLAVWRLVQAYGIFFCILSVGFSFKQLVLGEKEPIVFSLEYFLSIFMLGAAITIFVWLLIYLTLARKDKRND